MEAEAERKAEIDVAGDESRRKDGQLTTGDMARLSGSTLRTVRFYEEAGLLEPEQRTDGGHRLFSREQLTRLCFISNLRVAGFSLESIRDLLGSKRCATSGSEAAKRTVASLDGQIAALRERVQAMQELLQELDQARQTLRQCADCSRPDLFPDHCGACEVMQKLDDRTDSLCALWGLRK